MAKQRRFGTLLLVVSHAMLHDPKLLGETMIVRRTFLVVLALLLLSTSQIKAEPLAPDDVPSVLKPWIGWALAGSEEAACPNVDGVRTCIWPTTLSIDARATSATFTLNVTTFRRTLITLPGSAQLWPLDVRVDNADAIVIEPSGAPQIEVSAGSHVVQGRFAWSTMPDAMNIPAQVANVALSVDAKPVRRPRREENGLLWLRQVASDANEADTLELQVHRKIEDGIPLRITTRIQMAASGSAREVVLPNVLLAETRPIVLSSQLPARLLPDGTLRVQAEAGTFAIEILAIRETSASELVPFGGTAPWPESEIWVFVANDALRHVELSGPPAIDPARTDLAQDFRGLPTYVVSAKTPLKLEDKRRGQPDPAPNAITVQRSLWLDAKGGAYTVRDELRGTMNREFRLDLLSGQLGRVTVDGRDEMITRLGKSAGIELRKGAVNVAAEWRVKGEKELPAVGWSEDLRELSATLNLPPGYTLLGAEGVDRVPGTWLDSWNLWNFFFVLLIAIAVFKLSSPWWGALALFTLVLCHHEPDAPELVWLWLIAATALMRVFKEGRFAWIAKGLWLAGLCALLLTAVPFSVMQLRKALYPHLDRDGGAFLSGENFMLMDKRAALVVEEEAPAAPPMGPEGVEQAPAPQAPEEASKAEADLLESTLGASQRAGGAASKKRLSSYDSGNDSDPNAVVQTGPGLPSWSFQQFSLSWSGPVQRDQKIRLWLVPPVVTRAWSLLTVLLTFALLFALARASRPSGGSQGKGEVPLTALLTVLSAVFLTSGASAQPAQGTNVIPPSDTLTVLRDRLLEPAACEPNCVSASELSVTVVNGRMTLRAKVHAATSSAYRAPGPLLSFTPDSLKVDGVAAPAALRAEDGFLRVRVDKGVHLIELSGAVGLGQALTLSLGTPPHRVTVDAKGFEIDGLHEDGTAEGSLRLRPQISETESGAQEAQEALEPWLLVTRSLDLGVRFRLTTTLRRMGPASESILVRVPLLPSESVTEASLTVVDRQVVVEIPRDQEAVSFTSTLPLVPEIVLQAAIPAQKGGPVIHPFSETWEVSCASLLHCDFDGIAPVARVSAEGDVRPVYQPWPGETLRIRTQRLPPEQGASVTIDNASLELTPGMRLEQSVLRATVRASRGTTERFTMPKDEKLTRVLVDGVERPMRLKEGALELAFGPGKHEVTVEMQRASGIQTSYRGPVMRISRPLTNATTIVNVPEERWLLWAGGPMMGPAILFWGYLILVLLCAFALGRVPLTPLKSYEWMLLGLGLTQVPVFIVLFVIGWFFALAYREKQAFDGRWAFNLTQVALVIATLIALGCLAGAVHTGLVVQPDMQVQGMGSTNQVLRWYEDRTGGALPEVSVFSAPLWIYKGLMLAWALWLSASLIKWLRWGFATFRTGDTWKRREDKTEVAENPRVALEDIEAAKAALKASANKANNDAGDS